MDLQFCLGRCNSQFCLGRCTQLEVEAVPPGYPPVHDFLPDLEGFYRDWLGREVPV
jgi:acetone carboxylase, gamma subunit